MSFLRANKKLESEVDEVPFSFLKSEFETVPTSVVEGLDRYCRGYLLFLLGAVVFPSPHAGSGMTPIYYLPLLENIDNLLNYAWGAAMFAHLHYGLEHSSKGVWGPTLMLLVSFD